MIMKKYWMTGNQTQYHCQATCLEEGYMYWTCRNVCMYVCKLVHAFKYVWSETHTVTCTHGFTIM